MSLIDRYLQQVEKRLPSQIRNDVSAELRSALEDSLDAHRAEKPEEKEEVLMREVLREFGPPDRIARAYLPENGYLVGPRLFPAFALALKIVLGLAAAVLLIGLIGLVIQMDTGPVLFHSLARVLVLLLILLGLLTLVFAIVERGSRPRWKSAPARGSAWDPDSLPEAETGNAVSRTGAVARICVFVVLLLWLNLIPPLAVFFTEFGGWAPAHQLFAYPFSPLTALANIWLLAAIVFQFVLLHRGVWEKWHRWTDIILYGLAALVLIGLLFGGLAPGFHPLWHWVPGPWNAGSPMAQVYQAADEVLCRLMFAALLVLCLLQLYRHSRRLTAGD